MQTTIRKKLDSKLMSKMFNDYKIDIRYFEKENDYYNITIRHSEDENANILFGMELNRINIELKLSTTN